MKIKFDDGYGITDGELLQVQGQQALVTSVRGGLDCGTQWHPVSDIQDSEKVLLDFQPEKRECTCGSGAHWADCPSESQYCG